MLGFEGAGNDNGMNDGIRGICTKMGVKGSRRGRQNVNNFLIKRQKDAKNKLTKWGNVGKSGSLWGLVPFSYWL